MTATVEQLMTRAHTELAAVRALIDAEFHPQAVSRAYYASFYAAAAALQRVGKSRSKHSGVVSAFGRFIVQERGFDRRVSRALRDLFDLRNSADYDVDAVLAPDLQATIAAAGDFVATVENWLER